MHIFFILVNFSILRSFSQNTVLITNSQLGRAVHFTFKMH